jgi:hypothetical protein
MPPKDHLRSTESASSQNIIINNINFADKKEVCPGCGCTCPCECKDCEECATCCDH